MFRKTTTSVRVSVLAGMAVWLSVSSVSLAKVNAPVQLNGRSAKPAANQVVIYYANESDNRSLARMASWLKQYGTEEAVKHAKRLELDIELFAPTVYRQIDDLKQLVQQQGDNPSLGLIVFTNELARAGAFEYIRPGEKTVERGEFVVPAFDDASYTVNPLSHPDMLRQALRITPDLFSPTENEFVLICKSHGCQELVMTSLVTAKLGCSSFKELKTLLDAEDASIRADDNSTSPKDDNSSGPGSNPASGPGSNPASGPGSNPASGPGSNPASGPGSNPASGPGSNPASGPGSNPASGPGSNPASGPGSNPASGPGSNPASGVDGTGLSGTRKDELVAAIVKAGTQSHMFFTLVLLATCDSELPEPLNRRLAPHTGTLVTSEGGFHYQTVNYALFKGAQHDVGSALRNALQEAADRGKIEAAPGY